MSPATHRFFAGKQLVILGCGYIGGALARAAVERGMKVTALTRNPVQARALRAGGIAVVEADLADQSWHEAMPRTADFAVNTVSSGGGGVAGYRHSYVGGMRSIGTWARAAAPGVFVYTGSTSVYPQGGGVVVDETSPAAGGGERAGLLLEAEQLVRAGGFSRWFILRLAGIYGPGRHHLLDQLRAGEPLAGTGAHRLNLAHRDDIGAAIRACLMAPAGVGNEIFNVADDAPATRAELAAWLAGRMGLPAPRFDPQAPVRRAVVPDRIIRNDKLKRLLGWRPAFRDFRAGYENILATL